MVFRKSTLLWGKALFLLIIVFLVSFPAVSQEQSFQKQKLDSFFQALKDENKFMGAAAISRNGELVYNKAWGFRKVKDNEKIPSNTETKYRIGSVTKMFTATLVLQMVEAGVLDLYMPLAEFYPNIPNADSIRIKHLLQHQSGLPNITSKPSFQQWKTKDVTKEQLLDTFRVMEPIFSPGSKEKYSNTNFILLGYILEKAMDKDYEELLQQGITNRIGLKNTYFGETPKSVENVAFSFQLTSDRWNPIPSTSMNIPHGAGAMASTPGDLTKFIEALFDHRLIQKPMLDSMLGIEQRFGMGIIQMPFHEKISYGHTGGIDGFSAALAYFPEDSTAFALTSNSLSYSLNQIMIAMMSAYYGHSFKLPSFEKIEPIELPVEELSKYEGVFASDKVSMKITVEKSGDQLTAQATGQAAFPLTPTSDTTFRYEQAGVKINFRELKNNQYQQLILHQRGIVLPFTRKE